MKFLGPASFALYAFIQLLCSVAWLHMLKTSKVNGAPLEQYQSLDWTRKCSTLTCFSSLNIIRHEVSQVATKLRIFAVHRSEVIIYSLVKSPVVLVSPCSLAYINSWVPGHANFQSYSVLPLFPFYPSDYLCNSFVKLNFHLIDPLRFHHGHYQNRVCRCCGLLL